jgi:hypothetical protein
MKLCMGKRSTQCERQTNESQLNVKSWKVCQCGSRFHSQPNFKWLLVEFWHGIKEAIQNYLKISLKCFSLSQFWSVWGQFLHITQPQPHTTTDTGIQLSSMKPDINCVCKTVLYTLPNKRSWRGDQRSILRHARALCKQNTYLPFLNYLKTYFLFKMWILMTTRMEKLGNKLIVLWFINCLQITCSVVGKGVLQKVERTLDRRLPVFNVIPLCSSKS